MSRTKQEPQYIIVLSTICIHVLSMYRHLDDVTVLTSPSTKPSVVSFGQCRSGDPCLLGACCIAACSMLGKTSWHCSGMHFSMRTGGSRCRFLNDTIYRWFHTYTVSFDDQQPDNFSLESYRWF